jgi:CheY-like chemotaxis protein
MFGSHIDSQKFPAAVAFAKDDAGSGSDDTTDRGLLDKLRWWRRDKSSSSSATGDAAAKETKPVGPPIIGAPMPPRTREISMAVDAGPSGRRLAKAKSVLLVAADDTQARQWQHEIKDWGYAIEFVHASDPGLDKLFDVGYDAVLLDFQAPGIDGLGALQEIRGEETFKNLFIAVFVGDRAKSTEEETAATEAGANRVFRRAEVSTEAILTALKTALFPRVFQVQPRSRQQRAAEAARRSPSGLPGVGNGVTSRQTVISMPVEPNPLAPAAKKILIIEDDELLAGVYRTQLEGAGYEVEVALDGATGFHDLLALEPNAMLLDVFLPGMGGLDIIRKTRSQKRFEKLPIFVFTTNFSRELEAEARDAGVSRLFDKATTHPSEVVFALNDLFFPGMPAPAPAAAEATKKTVRIPLGKSIMDTAPTPMKTGVGGVKKDDALKIEIRETLLQDSPEIIKAVRAALGNFLRAQTQGDVDAREFHLLELHRRIHSLIGNAAIAGLTKLARLCSALDAMLREFQERADAINASTQRTLTQAIDFLAQLFTRSGTAEDEVTGSERILVVDDEIISRRVIAHSLEKAELKPTAVDHPQAALDLLSDQAFDLVFLDVEMPDMNGFELCKKLRALPQHARTPVIFVTALSGFDSRVKSSLSGGDDFIGKPFSYIELALKALIYVMRGQSPAGSPGSAPSGGDRVCVIGPGATVGTAAAGLNGKHDEEEAEATVSISS